MSTRHIWPWDRNAVLGHFLQLSPEDRHSRFCGTVSDLGIARYVEAIDWQASTLIGHFDRGDLVGLAELVPVRPRTDRRAEIAVSVAPDWQGQGLGEVLLRRALLAARNRFFTTVNLTILHENRAMTSLTAKVGADLEQAQDLVIGTFHPGFPTYLSLVREHAFDGTDLIESALHYHGAPHSAPDVGTPVARAS